MKNECPTQKTPWSIFYLFGDHNGCFESQRERHEGQEAIV